jgi:hypothetical protein
MSWRETTPQGVQDDLDLLADQALTAAQHFLEKNGEFYPFAITLADDGTPNMVGADPGEGEFPTSASVLELLREGVIAQRGEIRAAAFATDVTTESGDAARVEIEHRDGGPALALMLPYRRRGLRKKLELGELFAEAGQARVWT